MRMQGGWSGSTVAAFVLLFAVIAGLNFGSEAVVAEGDQAVFVPQSPPEWSQLFDPGGRLLEPALAGLDAVFLEDRVSGGEVIDISALHHAADPADALVTNGPISAPHDLGNAYLFARLDEIDLVFDIRVERLTGDAGTESYVEIEFNRELIAASSGRRFPHVGVDGETLPGYELRYPFRGERAFGDLALRVNLAGQLVNSVEFKRWENVDGVFDYHTLERIENLGDEACFGLSSFYSICSGSLIRDDGSSAYIANGDPEQSYAPSSYFEISLNVSRLAGPDPDFTTILITSPEDMSFGTFKAFGRFSNPSTVEESTATRRNSR